MSQLTDLLHSILYEHDPDPTTRAGRGFTPWAKRQLFETRFNPPRCPTSADARYHIFYHDPPRGRLGRLCWPTLDQARQAVRPEYLPSHIWDAKTNTNHDVRVGGDRW